MRLGRAADFRTGDLAATGLDPHSVAGVLCVDAIQFAEQPAAAYQELRRVLAPGGRRCSPAGSRWTRPTPAARPPAQGRPRGGLTGAGFEDVDVRERPAWRAAERAMWEEAAALDPGDDPALRSFHDEGVRSLQIFDRVRRVLATATAPA